MVGYNLMNLGKTVKRLRERQAYGLNAFAYRAKVNPTNLKRFESGSVASPSISFVCAVADALELPVDWLLQQTLPEDEDVVAQPTVPAVQDFIVGACCDENHAAAAIPEAIRSSFEVNAFA